VWRHELVIALLQVVLGLLVDLLALAALAFRPRRTTAAEILILRRQLLYIRSAASGMRILRASKAENPECADSPPSRWRASEGTLLSR